jgi:exosome complex component RRP41
MTPEGNITLLQMDGHLTREEFGEALELAKNGCKAIYELQRAALMEKYASQMEGDVIE